MQIIFATGNKGKLREASEILGEGYQLVTPADMGITEEIPETGNTIRENSIQKATYIFEHTGKDCFADDTGLEVDALGGAPGVYSARYAGASKDFQDNMDKLLCELAKTGSADRRARFRTVVTLVVGGEFHCFEGTLEGTIALEPAGTRGFGYDPVFIPDQYPGLTFAQMSAEDKNAISHRGKALRAMADWLNARHK